MLLLLDVQQLGALLVPLLLEQMPKQQLVMRQLQLVVVQILQRLHQQQLKVLSPSGRQTHLGSMGRGRVRPEALLSDQAPQWRQGQRRLVTNRWRSGVAAQAGMDQPLPAQDPSPSVKAPRPV